MRRKECRPEGSEEYFSDIYPGQSYEIDANRSAYDRTRSLFGDLRELIELYAFRRPKRSIPGSEYEKLYSRIDELTK